MSSAPYVHVSLSECMDAGSDGMDEEDLLVAEKLSQLKPVDDGEIKENIHMEEGRDIHSKKQRKHKKHKKRASNLSEQDVTQQSEAGKEENTDRIDQESPRLKKEDTVLALYKQDFNEHIKSSPEDKAFEEPNNEPEKKEKKEPLRRKHSRSNKLKKRKSSSSLLHYEWDKENIGENITVLEDRPHVARREIAKQSTDGLRGHRGFRTGRHTFEIVFNDKPWGSHCAVGVCTMNANLHCDGYKYLLGCDSESWGWDIPCKALLHGGEFKGELNFSGDGEDIEPEGAIIESQVPRRLRMTLDLDNSTLSYDLGNDRLVTAFRDVQKNGEEIFPCVAMVYGLLEVKIRLKESEIKTKDDSCQSNSAIEIDKTILSAENKEKSRASDEAKTNDTNAIFVTNTDPSKRSAQSKFESGKSNWDEGKSQENNFESAQSNWADRDCEDRHAKGSQEITRPYSPPVNDLYAKWSQSRSPNADVEDGDGDGDEDEEGTNSRAEDLTDEERYLLRLCHGWDFVMRGGLLQPHPNVPYICVPMPNLQDKVQAIRSKSGFSSGRHTWIIRELKFYSPTVNADDFQDAQNDLIIGVVNQEQRVFNFGFSLNQLGTNAWAFQPHSKLFWHDSYYASPQDTSVPSSLGDKGLDELEIDMTVGIEVTLDKKRRTLTFVYNGHQLCTVQKLKGKVFYPFVMYHKVTPFPVEIDYIEGPSSYIQSCVEKTRQMQEEDQEESSNFRPLLKRSSSRFITDEADGQTRKAFGWGNHSHGVHYSGIMSKNTVDISGGQQPEMVFSMNQLRGGRHVIRFSFDKPDQFVIGLVGDMFSQEAALNTQGYSANVPIFGDLYSWGWNIKENLLYHAGTALAKYPIVRDFDMADYETLLLTIDFSLLGYNVACFTAVKDNGERKELGLAWVNLAPRLWIAAARVGGEPSSIKMEYHAGSWKSSYKDIGPEDHHTSTQQQSSTCTVL